MVVLLWGLSWIILVGAAIFKAAGLLQEQGRDECDNRRGAQQEEQVAKARMKACFCTILICSSSTVPSSRSRSIRIRKLQSLWERVTRMRAR
jgi:hypothetical protein